MQILFDQAVHDLRNKGNNAMLQMAMERLSQFWPEASLSIVSIAPQLTRQYFKNSLPVSPANLYPVNNRTANLSSKLPSPILWMLLELRESLDQRRGSNIQVPKAAPDPISAPSQPSSEEYQATIRSGMSAYDLFVCTGGGVLYDFDSWTALKVFDRLEVAMSMGIPTVMMGQGIGTLGEGDLRFRARQVLPRVDLICVRNRRIGLATLESLGVPADRVLFTGDDAVELAYRATPDSLGNAIGISLRVAGYTEINTQHINRIRPIIQNAAQTRQARLVAIPISSHHSEADVKYIKQVLTGYSAASVDWRLLSTPLDVIKKARQCRLVITATYHGAIFALAQGIPVVALAHSAEYTEKLSELTDEFGTGCQILSLDDDHLSEKLTAAIDTAWTIAPQIRSTLLETAAHQVKLQQLAYQRICEIVTRRQKEQAL